MALNAFEGASSGLEAVVTVDETRISDACVMAMRVAVQDYIYRLENDSEFFRGLGRHGPLYQQRLREVETLLTNNLWGESSQVVCERRILMTEKSEVDALRAEAARRFRAQYLEGVAAEEDFNDTGLSPVAWDLLRAFAKEKNVSCKALMRQWLMDRLLVEAKGYRAHEVEIEPSSIFKQADSFEAEPASVSLVDSREKE